MRSNDSVSWDHYRLLRPGEKARYLRAEDETIQSFLYSQQVDRSLLDSLIAVADHCRNTASDIEQSRYVRTLLNARSCVLYFPQCSTRTFTSFSLASQALGMAVEEIRDPELSAMYKGESELDTLITLATLSDLIVMRQNSSELMDAIAYEVGARGLATRIVNAGSGSDQHPTQALLEVYTLEAHLQLSSPDRELTVAFVGDLKRSRTARSLSYLLALYPGIKHVFVAPEELQMEGDILSYLERRSIQYEQTEALDDVIGRADALYMMRIQDEYTATSDDLRRRYELYHLNVALVSRMKPGACILHPLPRRAELPVEIDRDPRAKYWEAVNRGKYMRMALLLHMFGYGDVERLRARLIP